jgi:hypothetical protein
MDSTNFQAPATVSFCVKSIFNGTSGSACCATPWHSQLAFYGEYNTNADPKGSVDSSGSARNLWVYFNNSAPATLSFWMRSDQAPVSFTVGIKDNNVPTTSYYSTPLTITTALTWQQFIVPVNAGTWDGSFSSLDWTQISVLMYNIFE